MKMKLTSLDLRIGEKPLYYAFIDDEFIFSSALNIFFSI